MNTDNELIARWLGYRQHSAFANNWYLPDDPEGTPGNCTIPTPDFTSDPIHYERIKTRFRELGYGYELNYYENHNNFRLCLWTLSDLDYTFDGASEGAVLVQCALALIQQGEES